MKGFHLVVILTAGPGIRDTQVSFFFAFVSSSHLFLPLWSNNVVE